jgi:Domain of unknown function (DUF4157)
VDPDLDLEEELVDHARAAAAPEPAASEHVHDQRPPLERMASDVGNRGFGQLVARMQEGGGILSGGLVHPDVEMAIAASRGRGSPLGSPVSRRLESTIGGPVDDVRVHTDDHAASLARAVSARAFTVGNDIFFGQGEYSPATPAGAELIAHEVAHVVQQRGAPLAGPLTVSQPGDTMEREADALARNFAG